MTLVGAAGLIAAGAAFWIIYFYFKDQLKPEPLILLGLAVLLGCGSAFLGLAVYWLAGLLGVPGDPGHGAASIFFYCVLIVGPIEEGVKFLVARVVIFRWRHFDEQIDGLIYASMVAIGFASVENLMYALFLPWPDQLARAATSPLTHSIFASIWGLGTARALLVSRTRGSRIFWQTVPLLLSMILHGLYDYFLLSVDAPFLSSGIILIIWVWMIFYARRLATTTHHAAVS